MTFSGTLLPYQPEAVEKMIDRKKMLVAYDLGLGKTVLTIAAIEDLMDRGEITEPGIVICLSSLKYQWASQIEKFTNGSSRALVVDGTQKQRAEQYHEAFEWRKNGIDYVIINYEQVVNDWTFVSSLPRGFIVVDEATAIKSFKSKRSRYVKQLDSKYKFALTGTPVENGKPEEIYSIMQFVDPKVLGRFDLFDATFIVRNQFGGVERYRNLPTLHKTLSKAIVRKRQQDPDVAPFLPEEIKAEPILIQFDRKSAVLYRQISTELLDDLDEALNSFGPRFDIFSHYADSDQGGIGDQLRGKIMSKLTALRMLCDHPDLLRHSADIFNAMSNEGSKYAWELKDAGMLQDLKHAPKLDVLVDFADNFLSEYSGNKVVIFTSYVLMTDIIAAALTKKGYGCSTYTGQMDAKTKEASKVEFQNNPDCRVLVSSDAGGYGVDLPQANMLINYDLPWNAGLAVQRNGRIKRASSTWNSVVIQDLLIDGSIEERQHALLEQKNAVANAVVDGEGINDRGGVNLTAGSLRSFLESSIV
jgi:SNF2 family DNA or RNA helicase